VIARFFEAVGALTAALDRNTHSKETSMASISDLTDAVGRVAEGVNALKEPLDQLVAAVGSASGLSAEDQRAINDAVDRLNAVREGLASDVQEAQSAVPAQTPPAGGDTGEQPPADTGDQAPPP
jgi:methyl-accepting chemotaxis protein